MSKKILIIDDEPDWQRLLSFRLEANGYEVLTADDGIVGYEVTVKHKPDLIILDVLMPKMTGYEFVQKLRSEGGPAKNVPVLVISARKSMEEYFNTWEIISFLPKPSTPEDLLGQIDKILGCHQPAAAPAVDKVSVPAPAPAPAASTGMKILLMGVDDYIVHKVKTAVEALGVQVVLGVSEEDAVKTAAKEQPDFFFCQFYEDTDKLDAQSIHLKLKKNEKTAAIPFIPFCAEAISLDAMKTVGVKDIIAFRTGNDLVQSISDFLKAHAKK